MNEENDFDRISRLLAHPMPRRRALKAITGVVAGAVLEGFWPRAEAQARATKGSAKSGTLAVLSLTVKRFKMHHVDVYDVVSALITRYQASVSFFKAVQSPLVNVSVDEGTVEDVLNQIVGQNAAYRWAKVNNRIFVFPNEPKFQTVVGGLKIAGRRADVAASYDHYLAAHVPGFKNLGGVFMADSNQARDDAPISLSPRATVLTHFTEILGGDPNVCFLVADGPNQNLLMQLLSVYPEPVMHKQVKPRAHQTEGNRSSTLFREASFSTAVTAVANASSPTCRGLAIKEGTYQDVCGLPTCICEPYPTVPHGRCGIATAVGYLSFSACDGDDCSGSKFTETASLVKSTCGPVTFNLGPGCPVTDGGNLTCCTDKYTLSYDPKDVPNGCAVSATQTISVDGIVVETKSFTYDIDVNNGVCGQPTFNNSSAPTHKKADCCGNNPPATGAGSKTLCNSPQTCVNNDVCCDAGITAACEHICCRPKTATYPGDACITDSITLKSRCCPVGTPFSCNSTCCKPGEACIKDSATGHFVCCSKSNTVAGACCPSGQTNCNGACCADVCCGTVCCSAGQTCAGGLCCGQPTPHTRMSPAAVARGSYATDDLAICCAPGYPPCGNVCCSSGSVCCAGACCAGTCDGTGACITPGENM